MANNGRVVDSLIVNSNKFNNSFFREFIDVLNPDVLTWALNVLEKLYDRGILPQYLERNSGDSDLFEDEDFISFFFSKTHFFAILVIYSRLFENIENNNILKRKFLSDMGLYVALDQSDDDLDYIFNNYISEFENRGTNFIHYIKGTEGNAVDGEILRLLNHKSSDEFVFALLSNDEIGWNLGNSSPTYKGTDKITNITKAYEFSQDVEDISLYPLENAGFISLNTGFIKIVNPTTSTVGIRYDGDLTKKIVVDSNVSYEMSFRITLDNASIFTFDFELGVDSYDVNNNSLGLVNNQDGVASNNFYLGTSDIFKITLTEYWVRCIIFTSDTVNDGGELLNVGYGNNLRFQNGVNYIVPKILFSNFSDPLGEILIRDFKFRPLELPFSLGMLGVKNFIVNFVENFSGRFQDNVENIIKNELVPYNSIYNPIFIE